MAQRTIHMLFAIKLAQSLELRDTNRFYFGSILPDSYTYTDNRQAAHYHSHFVKTLNGGTRAYFDFRDYFLKYRELVISDELYLGYYAHLIEDAFYRHFLYNEKDMQELIKSHELKVLHGDYHILNYYISTKYSLPSHISLPEGFENEPVNEISSFDTDKLIRDYHDDISETHDEKTVILTEDILEEFIARYLDIALAELSAAHSGSPCLEPENYIFIRKTDRA